MSVVQPKPLKERILESDKWKEAPVRPHEVVKAVYDNVQAQQKRALNLNMLYWAFQELVQNGQVEYASGWWWWKRYRLSKKENS